ncbi:MFS transporter [Actinomadura chibensis]|uniref:MFS transporter n=1 Tax=Actinomadura chibensis TaxID=392828 RepID=UPI000A5F8FC5|nr:MFS transporter [Actinomadura chibensis]
MILRLINLWWFQVVGPHCLCYLVSHVSPAFEGKGFGEFAVEKPLSVAASPAAESAEFEDPSYSWVFALFGVTLGMWIGLLAAAQVLLPSQIEAIDPSDKVWLMGAVTTSGAVAAVLAAPVMGALSDRTRWGFGKRRCWVLGGIACCAAALLTMSRQSSVVVVGICWTIVHGGVGGIHAVLCAIIPDKVPVHRRGTVFAILGFAQPLGLVLGTLLVSGLSVGVGYPVVAALVVVLALPYALIGRDVPAAAEPSPVGRWLPDPSALGRDFGWAWAGRFAAQFATSLATIYLLYFLRDQIKMGDPAKGVAVLSLLYTAGIVTVSLVVGRISDRVRKRKVFVILAAVLMAGALTGMALVPTWPTAVAAATALGAGYGAYLAVDQALATQLLRSEGDRGKDLGTMNMSTSAAVAIAPVVAAESVAYGGYPMLFFLAAGMAVLGGFLVQPIKSVR